MVYLPIWVKSKKRNLSLLVIGLTIFSLSLIVFDGHRVFAATDTCTWTGSGVNSNITTAGNWTGCDNGNVPQSGDSLVFPTGPTNKIVTLNSGIAINNITLSGSGYTINTSSPGTIDLFISNNVTISGNNNTINARIWLFPTTESTFTHSGTGTTIAQTLALQPEAVDPDITFDIQNDLTLPMIAQATGSGGQLSLGTVTKSGTGKLTITGESVGGMNATNGIYINEGIWQCDDSFCLGSSSNEIILNDDGDSASSTLMLNFDGTFDNDITTNAVTGSDAALQVGGDLTLNGSITLHDDFNFFVIGDHEVTVESNIAMDDAISFVVYGSDGYQTNVAVFNGNISGNAGLIVDDTHVTLAGTNTYTGTTELYNTGGGAVVTVKDNNSLGNSSSGTIVGGGTTLNFDNSGDVSYDEPITVTGTGVGGSYPGALVKSNQYVALNGAVSLTGNSTWHNATSEIFVTASVISGDYDLSFTNVQDNGGFGLQPNGNNSFDDLVATGTQLLISGAGNTAVPGNLTLNAVDGKLTRLWLNNDNTIANNSVIALNNDGDEEATLINTGVTETLGTIVGDGTIAILDSDGHFSFTDATGEFSGILNGYANSIIEINGGTWTFSGRSVDVGDGYESFYINGGSFIANASDTSLGLSPFSISEGVLGGTGIIGGVSVYGGTISPGNSPGCLYPSGDVAFTDPFSIYHQQIQGDTACTGYDVLNTAGTIYLNSATFTLELLANTQLTHDHVYTIMQGVAIDGTFNGLADGDTVTVNSYPFRINYNDNNVTLTYIGETTSVAESVSSGSSSANLASTGTSAYLFIIASTVLISTGSVLGLGSRLKYLLVRAQ